MDGSRAEDGDEDDDEEYEEGEEEEEEEEGGEGSATPAEAEAGDGEASAAGSRDPDDIDADDDEDYSDLSKGTFFCAEVKASGLPIGPGVPTEVPAWPLLLLPGAAAAAHQPAIHSFAGSSTILSLVCFADAAILCVGVAPWLRVEEGTLWRVRACRRSSSRA